MMRNDDSMYPYSIQCTSLVPIKIRIIAIVNVLNKVIFLKLLLR